jgi:hypothetical protein
MGGSPAIRTLCGRSWTFSLLSSRRRTLARAASAVWASTLGRPGLPTDSFRLVASAALWTRRAFWRRRSMCSCDSRFRAAATSRGSVFGFLSVTSTRGRRGAAACCFRVAVGARRFRNGPEVLAPRFLRGVESRRSPLCCPAVARSVPLMRTFENRSLLRGASVGHGAHHLGRPTRAARQGHLRVVAAAALVGDGRSRWQRAPRAR